MKITLMSLIVFLSFAKINAQTIELLHKNSHISLRGLSVVNDHTFWVSGSKGTVGLSVDAGKTIKWMNVKGYDSIDFRDIEAFSSTEAIIMGIAQPAYVLKTNDAGETWKLVYQNNTDGMFLDAMEWWNQESGIIIGDPIEGKPFFVRTFDAGATWMELPKDKLPNLEEGEACFASSGTNIRTAGRNNAFFITGGKKSRFFRKNTATVLPIIQGQESTGANSLAVHKDLKRLIIVGGDFNKKDDTTQNCVLSKNGGNSFYTPTTPPLGYRSCVEFIKKNTAITCGLNGVDISKDAGNNWTNISKEGFHVCRKAKNGTTVYLAGGNGKIAVFKP